MSKYDDIINLPHPVSTKHPQMSMHSRAGQFSPYAALVGYYEEVDKMAIKAARDYEAAGLFYNSEDIDSI